MSKKQAQELRLENARKPFEGSIEEITQSERAQMESFLPYSELTIEGLFEGSEEDDGDLQLMDIVNVVDNDSGEVMYQLYAFPYGDGYLFENQTTKVIANICQHGFDPVGRKHKALVRAFGRAWLEGAERLDLWTGLVDFSDEELGKEAAE